MTDLEHALSLLPDGWVWRGRMIIALQRGGFDRATTWIDKLFDAGLIEERETETCYQWRKTHRDKQGGDRYARGVVELYG